MQHDLKKVPTSVPAKAAELIFACSRQHGGYIIVAEELVFVLLRLLGRNYMFCQSRLLDNQA